MPGNIKAFLFVFEYRLQLFVILLPPGRHTPAPSLSPRAATTAATTASTSLWAEE